MAQTINHTVTDELPMGRLELQSRIEDEYISQFGADEEQKPARYEIDVLGPALTLDEDLDIPVPVVSEDRVMAQFLTLRKGKHRVIEQPDGTRLIGFTKPPSVEAFEKAAENLAGDGDQSQSIQLELTPYEIDVNGTLVHVSTDGVVLGFAVKKAREAGDSAEVGRIMGMFYSTEINGEAVSLGELLELGDKAAMMADAIARGIGDVRHVMNTLSKTASMATCSNLNGSFYEDGGRLVRVSGENEAEITTMLTLSYDGGVSTDSLALNEYDKLVHDGVATLWANGHVVFTIKQLTELITGHKVTKNAECSRVEESVAKQWRTHVRMNFSEEMRGRTVTVDGEEVTASNATAETSMLNLVKETVTTKDGRKYEAYRMIAPPVFYWHDQAVKQITTYPRKLLEADTGLSATVDTLVLKNALITRIARMKRKGAKSQRGSDRHIRYLTLMKEAGLVVYDEDTADDDIKVNKVEASRVRDKVAKILDSLKREKYIKDWKEYAVGRRKEGVEIVL